jgi:hypothetical protein
MTPKIASASSAADWPTEWPRARPTVRATFEESLLVVTGGPGTSAAVFR